MVADLFGVLHGFALDDVDGGKGGGDGHGVSSEGGGVRAGKPVHDFGAGDEGGERQAAGDALGYGDHVRGDAGVFDGPPLTGASHAGLDFVDDQQDAVLVADAAQFLEESRGRGKVSAFALDGFDDDGGALLGRNFGAEDPVFDVARGIAGILLGLGSGGTAIEIGIGDVHDSGNQRRETAALLNLGAGERERAHGASVKGSVEGDDVLALGVVAGELECGLDGFGAGVAVVDAMRAGHGRDLREAGGEFGELGVIEIGAGHVKQLACLLLNGGDDLGMTVAGRGHGDSGGEIEKLVAIHVLDHDAASALGDQRVGAGVRGRDEACHRRR